MFYVDYLKFRIVNSMLVQFNRKKGEKVKGKQVRGCLFKVYMLIEKIFKKKY